MSRSSIGLGVGITIIAAALATPHSAPAALRYTEAALIVAILTALAVALVVLKVRQRREDLWLVAPLPVRFGDDGESSAFPFFEDDPHPFARMYSIVRQIHGDDIAARLTDEQIIAEYVRYDRAEDAASEDHCQTCDPERVPATHLVEGWDERPGHERYLGEWVLCGPHAEQKVATVRNTGGGARMEAWSNELPLAGGDKR